MEVSILNIINSSIAINHEDGVVLFDYIKNILPSDLTISFQNVSLVSTQFLNESIGKYAQLNPSEISNVKFIYPADNNYFSLKVADVIENALMGEDYSALVDNASASL